MWNMKKYLIICMTLLSGVVLLTSCDEDETYAEQKDKERKVVAAFLERDLAILNEEGDTTCYVGKINVISEMQFEAQGDSTSLEKNEYVLFNNSGVYMQILRKGPGEKLQDGQSKRIISRFMEYNILGDSIQLRDDVPYWHTNPEIMDVSNNSGTITASFNTQINGGGAMYMTYQQTTVPNGWIVPLSYVNLGRQVTADEGIAKVRLIVPHSQGHSASTKGVYPCFYELTYQEMRD